MFQRNYRLVDAGVFSAQVQTISSNEREGICKDVEGIKGIFNILFYPKVKHYWYSPDTYLLFPSSYPIFLFFLTWDFKKVHFLFEKYFTLVRINMLFVLTEKDIFTISSQNILRDRVNHSYRYISEIHFQVLLFSILIRRPVSTLFLQFQMFNIYKCVLFEARGGDTCLWIEGELSEKLSKSLFLENIPACLHKV